LEGRLDGGGDELGGLRVDGDVPAEQHGVAVVLEKNRADMPE